MAIAEEQRSSRCRKNSHGEQVDGLSELPESVICHILSLLSTQDSVATSILGRRWRYLWAYVPTLDFDCKNQEIIYRVMLQHRVQTLTTFRLHYETRCSCFELETWINFATLRNVQKLDLCFRDEDGSIQSDLLPRCLFTCKTLVDLRLDSCGVIPISRSRRGAATVCLPRLKKLHLIFVGYEADESLPHLLFGCPVLEELEIRLGWDMVSCNVSSPTMKRLMFNFINPRGGRAQRLEINTPALEYLKIDDFFYDHINIKCGVLTSLVEAQIILDSDPMVLDFRSLLYIVDKLCNLKYLKLDLSCCLKIVGSAPSPWTTSFRNLTKLKLRVDCPFLSMFLKNAANLETLIFDKHCLRDMKCCEEIRGWTEPPPQQVPTCLLSRLRIVKFAYLEGKKHEFEIIRYLLRNALVLERMEIAYGRSLDSEAKVRMLEEISLFQRGSASCEVGFVRPFKVP